MEPIQLWQAKWSHGPYVPMYLYFGGLTAGVYVVAVLADCLGIKWRRADVVSKAATYTSIVVLGLAGFFLTIHLGKPERGLAFPIFFTNYESWITRGGWIVGISTILVGLYVVLRYFNIKPWLRRLVGVVGLPVLTMLAIYTGLLLSHAGFVPLWSKEYLPVLFLSSGMTTGLAAVGFVVLMAWPFLKAPDSDPRRVVRWMSLVVVVFILLEGYELYRFMTFLAESGKTQPAPSGQFVAPKGGALAYAYVTQGALAPWFWWGIIGVGLGIPLLLTLVEFAVRPWARVVATAKFAMILVGGVILRFVIVWGGDLKAPLPFPPSKWPIPPVTGG